MRLIWLHEARGDVSRLFDFLVERDPEAALRAVQAIRTAADTLIEHPMLGRRMDEQTQRRELVVPAGAGAYVLRYRLHTDQVVILRVWHSRETRL